MKISIRESDFNKILEYALQQLPNEACGLIAGLVDNDGSVLIRKAYLLTNVDQTNEHFSIDPKEQLTAVKDMRTNGLIPLGNWHSHPETPARPSEEDIRLANDPKARYLILSLAQKDVPVLNAFRIVSENAVKIVSKEEIEIIKE